jgi:hypothetical protein
MFPEEGTILYFPATKGSDPVCLRISKTMSEWEGWVFSSYKTGCLLPIRVSS